jgi:hypothetical protein
MKFRIVVVFQAEMPTPYKRSLINSLKAIRADGL